MTYPDFHIGTAHLERDSFISDWIAKNIHKLEYHRYGVVNGFTELFYADCLEAAQMPNTIMNRVLVGKLALPYSSSNKRFELPPLKR
jgi:hypothetical protein